MSGVKGFGGEKASVSAEKLSFLPLAGPCPSLQSPRPLEAPFIQQPVEEEGSSLIGKLGEQEFMGEAICPPRAPALCPLHALKSPFLGGGEQVCGV